MFGSEEREQRAALIITTLVKFYVAVELSGADCPLCSEVLTHDGECPLSLAWSLISADQQAEARRNVRAFASGLGRVDEWPDILKQ